MPIDDRTTNRSYKLPNAGNPLADDVVRLRDALQAIDADIFSRYTKTEVDTLINGLIAGAPGALNTLDELAAALGDDANFAATVTNILALKANITDVYSKAESDARYVQGQVQAEMVFIATANQSVFTLSTPVINKPSALVTVDGVVKPTAEYSLNQTGTTLTLSEGVPAGTVVRVLALGVSSEGAPADDTVTTPKLRDGAVTTAKLADGALAASTAGMAKMADGFFAATAAALAKFADGFLAATTAGRAKMADGFVTTAKLDSGAVTPAKMSQPLTRATAQTASGTSVDFNNIPSWARRITVMFDGVSTTGSNLLVVQIGDSGGVETSGYQSGAFLGDNSNSYITSSSAGLLVAPSFLSTQSRNLSGVMTLCNITGNTWAESCSFYDTFALNSCSGAGAKTLSDVLDRVRITTVGGTDSFDSGTINILYE